MDSSIFKAYDIRGKYPEQIDEEAVAKIAGALAKYFKRKAKNAKRKVIIIGHDARLSSPALYRAFLRSSNHSHVLKNVRMITVGMMTTPMLYFLVNHFGAAGGAMITASHNPKEDNGVKAVGPKAVPISGKEILRIVNQESRIKN